MASFLYNVTISEAWDYWCYYHRVIRNKNTGTVINLDSGKFNPLTSGFLRVGKKISEIDDDTEIIEYTTIALKPDLKRVSNQDTPNSVRLMLYLPVVVLNEGDIQLSVTVKPWANSSGINWTSDNIICYDDIVDHYIPFDLTVATYVSSTYEKSVNVEADEYRAEIIDLEATFDKFLLGQTIGFAITATNGYADVYGPEYTSLTVRPQFAIEQTISNRFHGPHIILDTEIVGSSKIKGVCRDKDRIIITGRQCRVTVYEKDSYRILGTGLSASIDGAFLVSLECKTGELVIVSFYDSSGVLTGSEIMTTVSSNTG